MSSGNLSRLIMFRTITPLHAGSGQDLGIVDMPIQRETTTNYPKIESASLKGSFRHNFESRGIDDKLINDIFGKSDSGGKVAFTDARILFFPIKSQKGVYALVTCNDVLARFKDALVNNGVSDSIINIEGLKDLVKATKNISYDECYIFTLDKSMIINTTADNIFAKEKIVTLDDYSFQAQCIDKGKKAFKKIEDINKRIVIVSDDVFSDLVSFKTEIITRNKIDNETGTAVDTGLFTEEYLPTEAILYSVLIEFKDINNDAGGHLNNFQNKLPNIMQIGGNASLGKGLVELIDEKGGK